MSWHRLLAAALITGTLATGTGCHTWRIENAPLPNVLEHRPAQLQVRLADSSVGCINLVATRYPRRDRRHTRAANVANRCGGCAVAGNTPSRAQVARLYLF